MEYEGSEIDVWDTTIPLWIRVAAWIGTLDVRSGALMGQPFDLQEFQLDVIKAICDEAYEHVLLSIARGNGKTGLMAAIAACGVAGPLIVPNTEIPVVATNKDQAQITVKAAFKLLKPWFLAEPRKYRHIQNDDKGFAVHNKYDDVKLNTVSADPRTKHGGAPALAIEDEPAQWPPTSADLVHNAIMDGRGKQKHSRILTIGTQPADEYHFMTRAMRVGLSAEGRKAGIWARCYAADPKARFDDITQIKKANPMWNHMPDLRETIKKGIQEIKTGARSEHSFKAYRLNMGTDELANREYILGDNSIEIWKSCCVDDVTFDIEYPRDGIFFIAIDTGQARSLTAANFYWPKTGRFETYAAVPIGKFSLADREVKDKNIGVYTAAEKCGELKAYPKMNVPVDQFIEWVYELCDGWVPEKIFADSYKENEVEQAILELGQGWKSKLEIRRVGAGKDGFADVNGFVKEVTEGRLKSRKSPLMLAAIKDAEIKRDTSDNPSLLKGRQRGRIDNLQAGIMAVGAGYRSRMKGSNKKKRRHGTKSYVF